MDGLLADMVSLSRLWRQKGSGECGNDTWLGAIGHLLCARLSDDTSISWHTGLIDLRVCAASVCVVISSWDRWAPTERLSSPCL